MFADKYNYKVFLSSESLSKLKSTKFAPPPCTPQAAALPQNTHTDTSSVQLLDVCGCNQLVVCAAPGTNRRKKKTKDYGEKKQTFILQIKLAVFLWGKLFL